MRNDVCINDTDSRKEVTCTPGMVTFPFLTAPAPAGPLFFLLSARFCWLFNSFLPSSSFIFRDSLGLVFHIMEVHFQSVRFAFLMSAIDFELPFIPAQNAVLVSSDTHWFSVCNSQTFLHKCRCVFRFPSLCLILETDSRKEVIYVSATRLHMF